MTAKKVLNLTGVIIGIVIIIFGIVFASDPAMSFSTSSADSASFGADFYTYQYKATTYVVRNTAVTANNIREMGEKMAEYVGTAFIFFGILCSLHFIKEFVNCAGTAIPVVATSGEPVEPENNEVPSSESEQEEETAESEDTPSQGDWECPQCGRINQDYVGTCGCGQTKP